MERLCQRSRVIAAGVIFAITFAVSCTTTSQPENAHLLRGNQFARDGLFREAAESYRLAVQSPIDSMAARRNLGMVLVKLGDFKNAANQLERAITHYENNFDANFYLAESYRALGKESEAIFRYQRALKIQEADPKALKALAWSYFKIRFYREALATAKRAYQVAPKDEQVVVIYTRVLTKIKRFTEAFEILARVKAAGSGQVSPYVASVFGDVYFEQKNCTEASNWYRLALKDKPMLAGALLGIARCMVVEGNGAQAVPYAERAVRVRPNLAEGYLVLGRIFEKTDPKRAHRHFREFLKHAGTDPDFLATVGEVKVQMAQKQKASATVPDQSQIQNQNPNQNQN
jgi:tetratricopeptide (TPR) repeat protein